MHSLFSLLLKLIPSIKWFSWIVIEIQQTLIYISVSRPADCAKPINLEDNGFLQAIFWTLSNEGELFSLGRIRWHSLFTRWHSRGFLPNVRGRINKTHIFWVLRFFYPMEAFSRLLQVSKMQVFCLYVLYDRILFWREHTVYIGFRWRSRVSFDFLIQFSIFSNSMCLQIATIPANTVPDNFQLVYFWLWKAHVNFVQTFICHNTKVQPACR